MNADDVIKDARRWADLHRANAYQREGVTRVDALLTLAEELCDEYAEAEAALARVCALVTGGEQREATSLTRMFNGDPFPALFTTADIRAALDGQEDQ